MVLRFGDTFINGTKENMRALLAAYPGLKKSNSAALVSAIRKHERQIESMRYTAIDGLDVRISRIPSTH